MILKNKNIYNALNNAIKEYNESISESEKFKKIPEINFFEREIDNDTLARLSKLICCIDINETPKEEIDRILNELSVILREMKLDTFAISFLDNKQNKNINVKLDFLKSLNSDISSIGIEGADLSDGKLDEFFEFPELKKLYLYNASINSLDSLADIAPEIELYVQDNPLEQSITANTIMEIIKRKGKIEFSDDCVFSKIAMAIRNNENIINLNGIDINDDNIYSIIELLNGLEGYEFVADLHNLAKLQNAGDKFENNLSFSGRYIASSINEVSIEELMKRPDITEIQITNGLGYLPEKEELTIYTREQLIELKKTITKVVEVAKKIISKKDFADVADVNSQKALFMTIYQILGENIEYDHLQIDQEHKGNSAAEKSVIVRNIYGGLKNGKAVCLGYAQILKAALDEANIKCKIVVAEKNDISYLKTDNPIDQDKYHAWNIVELDGEEYQCDLTWDASSIKQKRYFLSYCLTSGYEFNHILYDTELLDNCIPEEEQRALRDYYLEFCRGIDSESLEEDFDEVDRIAFEYMELESYDKNEDRYLEHDNSEDLVDDFDDVELKKAHREVMKLMQEKLLKGVTSFSSVICSSDIIEFAKKN